jgi:hypothetical protein
LYLTTSRCSDLTRDANTTMRKVTPPG